MTQFVDLPFDTFKKILLEMDCDTLVNMWNTYKFENYFTGDDKLSTYSFWIQYLNKLTTYDIYYPEYERYNEYTDEDREHVIREIKEHSQILCSLNDIVQKDVYTTLMGTGILENIKNGAMDDSFIHRDNMNFTAVLGNNILNAMKLYIENMTATLYEMLDNEYYRTRVPVEDTIKSIFRYHIEKQDRVFQPIFTIVYSSYNGDYDGDIFVDLNPNQLALMNELNIDIRHKSSEIMNNLEMRRIFELHALTIERNIKEPLFLTFGEAYVYYQTGKIDSEEFKEKLDDFLDFFMENNELEGFNYDAGENKQKYVDFSSEDDYWSYIKERLGGNLL